MKKTFPIKRLASLLMVLVTLVGSLSILAIPSAAASYSSNYSSYNQPESNDFARWSGSKVVKGSETSKDEIKWMQAALNWCITNAGLKASKLDVDGSFGPASKAATQAFQRKYGLSVDGSFGPATIAKMKQVLEKKPSTYTNFHQYDSPWGTKVYGNSNLKNSGCGILSVVTAVYNLTGNFLEPTTLASWAYNNHYYNGVNGQGGITGNRINYMNNLTKKFGNTYGFKLDYAGEGNCSSEKLIKHLQNGGTAVVRIPGHYMAIVDYDANTKTFLLLDPYNTSGRSTTADGDWKSATSNPLSKVQHIFLFSKK